MFRVSHTGRSAASFRLVRVASHLQRAGKELTAATHAATDHHHQKQLHSLLIDLRALSSPIAEIVTYLERGGRP